MKSFVISSFLLGIVCGAFATEKRQSDNVGELHCVDTADCYCAHHELPVCEHHQCGCRPHIGKRQTDNIGDPCVDMADCFCNVHEIPVCEHNQCGCRPHVKK